MQQYFENPTYTEWQNPTDKRVTVDVFMQNHRSLNENGLEGFRPPQGWRAQPNKVRLVFEPGTTVRIPSEYDRAIHTVDKNGMIVGGQAPQLVKVGAERNLHPALDSEKVQKAMELETLAQTMMARTVAEKAVEIAAQQAASSIKKTAAK